MIEEEEEEDAASLRSLEVDCVGSTCGTKAFMDHRACFYLLIVIFAFESMLFSFI